MRPVDQLRYDRFLAPQGDQRIDELARVPTLVESQNRIEDGVSHRRASFRRDRCGGGAYRRIRGTDTRLELGVIDLLQRAGDFGHPTVRTVECMERRRSRLFSTSDMELRN